MKFCKNEKENQKYLKNLLPLKDFKNSNENFQTSC